jgi:hypothetical protein
MELPSHVSQATVRHCAAFMFGSFSDLINNGGGSGFIQHQGTITFVELDGRYYGITNEHCLGIMQDQGDLVYQVGLPRQKPARKPAMFVSKKDNPDFPFDVAIFRLDDGFLDGSTKAYIKIDDLASIIEGDTALSVGFPGHRRRDVGSLKMVHEAWHVVLRCESASDRNIWLRDSVRFDAASVDIGGMSGGPLFKLNKNLSFDFVGITYEQRCPDVVQDAQMLHEVAIVGFPLSGQLLRNMLDSVR